MEEEPPSQGPYSWSAYRPAFSKAVAENVAEAFCRSRMQLLSGAMVPTLTAESEVMLSPFWIQMSNTYASMALLLKWWLPSRSEGKSAEANAFLIGAVRDHILSMEGQFYGQQQSRTSIRVLPFRGFKQELSDLHENHALVFDLAARFASYDPRESDVGPYEALRSLVWQSVMARLGIDQLTPGPRAFGSEIRRLLGLPVTHPGRRRLEACLTEVPPSSAALIRGLYSDGPDYRGWDRMAELDSRYRTHSILERDLAVARVEIAKCLPYLAELASDPATRVAPDADTEPEGESAL